MKKDKTDIQDLMIFALFVAGFIVLFLTSIKFTDQVFEEQRLHEDYIAEKFCEYQGYESKIERDSNIQSYFICYNSDGETRQYSYLTAKDWWEKK